MLDIDYKLNSQCYTGDSPQPHEAGAIIIPGLQMRKLRSEGTYWKLGFEPDGQVLSLEFKH